MDLLLWRVPDAEESPDDIRGKKNDLDRQLTERGIKQAEKMARLLQKNMPKKLNVLISNTTRAKQSAKILGLPYLVDRALAPDASLANIYKASGWPDHSGARLLISHQLPLGRLAALLLCGEDDAWHIKKGALWWISNRERRNESQTVLRAVIPPDIL